MNILALDHLEADRLVGVYSCMYCQLNSASTKEYRDKNTHEIKQMFDCCSVQGIVMYEYCTHFGNMQPLRRPAL
jgi:hypothetical protein